MKRLIALFLALTLVFGLAAASFADDDASDSLSDLGDDTGMMSAGSTSERLP